MQPSIHFVSGLPRSGSTLLLNLLGQNPAHHVTPTNGLINMVAGIRDGWTRNDAFKAQGLDKVHPRIGSSIRGMMYGFYERELTAQKVVFDKNRGWVAFLEVLDESFGRPMKAIVTVRDMKAIVASFEKLHRANPLYRHPYLGEAYFAAQTIEGRARVLLDPKSMVGIAVNRVRDAMNRGTRDHLVLVPYGWLTTNPQGLLLHLHETLNLPSFEYDPNNVEQITVEDDLVHGWGPKLHQIRAKVEPPASAPWEGILPPHVCQWLDKEYADINQLARLGPLPIPKEGGED